MGALLSRCSSLQDQLIEALLDTLTPVEKNFGAFGVSLESADHDDDESVMLDWKNFSLNGINLHGKVWADIPYFGHQELPINIGAGVSKEPENRSVSVNVGDIDFDSNDHADEPEDDDDGTTDRDINLMGMMQGAAAGYCSGGVMGAFMSILNQDDIKDWISQHMQDAINSKVQAFFGGDDSEDDSD